MGWKTFFSFLFILFASALLIFYWFFPMGEIEFNNPQQNSDGTINNNFSGVLQFYPNMRYSDKDISYTIKDCNIQKKQNMQDAFAIISNRTIVNFYEVESGEEISVTCDNKNKIEDGMFIAGEGGPTNITKTNKFNVIFNGQILLIRESDCNNPNVAIHELLHAMGFDHSSNKNNIMYNVSNCKQTLSEDVLSLINELYSVESLPDLAIENVSAVMRGKYLDTNLTIRNDGLKSSKEANLKIYTGDSLLKEIPIESLEVGYGRGLTLTNFHINKISIDNLRFEIDYPFSELDKSNNEVVLELKK